MEDYVTLTLTDKNIDDYNHLKDKFLHAFDGVHREIPETIAVRVIHHEAPTIIVTFKYAGNSLIDVHFEVEGYALLNARSDSFFFPRFDMRAKAQKGPDHKIHISIVKPPEDMRTVKWLNTDFAPGTTNFTWIMQLHHAATRIVGYLPFTLDYKITSNGKKEVKLVSNFIEVATAGIENFLKEEREKHRFDGWDVIRLNWDQYEKISSIVEDTGKIDSLETLPLDKFAVFIQDLKGEPPYNDNAGLILQYTYMGRNELSCNFSLTNIEGDVECVYEVQQVKNPLTGEARLAYTYVSDDSDNLSPEENALFKSCGGDKNTVDVLFGIFVDVSSFMLNYKDETMDVEERVCEKPSEGKRSKKHHRSAVRLFKSYTLKKGWKTKANRKKAEIHCLAWGVRGHYRHYSNGKVIFISPYVKGKERAKYAGKDYLLLPEAN